MIDVDCDFSGLGRDAIYSYLKEKFGDEQVLHVGTTSTLGPASAVKDIARVYGLDFGKTNEFTKVLEKDISWEENIENIKYNYPPLYKFYQDHLEIFEMIPHFINKTRQCLPWNQCVDIIDKHGDKVKKLIKFINPFEDYILYMDKEGNIKITKNYDVFPSGKKKIYEIITSKGKKIRASANHKFFLKNGEVKKLRDLNKNDEIIVDYAIPPPCLYCLYMEVE